jgi:hypothetical protein
MVHLYGFLEDDILGRVIVAPSTQTIDGLGRQLCAWVWPWGTAAGPVELVVDNESGDRLDTAATVEEAGLSGGDIFRVRRA